MSDGETIQRRFELLDPYLDERTRRLMVAAEAQTIGESLSWRLPLDCLVTPSAELAEIDLRRDSFHGEWNYAIFPRGKKEPA